MMIETIFVFFFVFSLQVDSDWEHYKNSTGEGAHLKINICVCQYSDFSKLKTAILQSLLKTITTGLCTTKHKSHSYRLKHTPKLTTVSVNHQGVGIKDSITLS